MCTYIVCPHNVSVKLFLDFLIPHLLSISIINRISRLLYMIPKKVVVANVSMNDEYLHEAPVKHDQHGYYFFNHKYQDDHDRGGQRVVAQEDHAFQHKSETLLLIGPWDASEVATHAPY